MRTLIARVAVVALAVAAVAVPSQALAAACPNQPIIAHRGGTERYVENTRDAFRDSANGGIIDWETDTQFTADDVPVIMHDDTVDRTTDGTGPVSGFTLAQLEQLRTDDDQPVPTVADLINDAEVDGATVFIELKTVPTENQWKTFLDALGSRPAEASRVIVTSFNGATLQALRAHTPLYRTGLIQELGDQAVASVTQYGTNILIKHHNAITSSRMAVWIAGGLSVYSWTVDSASEMQRMGWYNLAGNITDDPHVYLAWERGTTC